MTSRTELDWDHAPSAQEMAALDVKVDESLVTSTGHVGRGRLGIVLRRDGQVVGGVHGLIWGGCCELVSLWVDEPLRGRGMAARLVDGAERDARDRGCVQIVVFTHFTGEPTLYLRAGYAVVGTVLDYPVGSAAHWLRKTLD